VLATATGGWHSVFIVAVGYERAAALMAWFVLRPMRRARFAKQGMPAAAAIPAI
jgi:OFA family oxalate/formate antiporter-like MFS transporter